MQVNTVARLVLACSILAASFGCSLVAWKPIEISNSPDNSVEVVVYEGRMRLAPFSEAVLGLRFHSDEEDIWYQGREDWATSFVHIAWEGHLPTVLACSIGTTDSVFILDKDQQRWVRQPLSRPESQASREYMTQVVTEVYPESAKRSDPLRWACNSYAGTVAWRTRIEEVGEKGKPQR